MKQADVINSVANKILRNGLDASGRNIIALIEQEYRYRGKQYKGDPSRMMDKITSIVNRNRRSNSKNANYTKEYKTWTKSS